MSPSAIALLAAALVASEPAEPQPTGDLYASFVVPQDMMLGAGPMDQLEGTLFGVLPPPPTIVVRQTHYYGTITIDHRAHLARRISCKLCHGPKPVGKIGFTPRVAHERCVGCHQTIVKGPTKCQGCHVKSATPPPLLVATAAPAAAAETPKAPEPNPGNVAAALAAFDAPKSGAGGGVFEKDAFHRSLEMGLTAGNGGWGGSVRMAFQQDWIQLSHSFERLSSDSTARTLALFGAGISQPVRSRISLQGSALLGFDVVDHPVVVLFPSIGARAGVELRLRSSFIQKLTASVTGVFDLSPRAYEHDIGGVTLYGTLATGFSLP
ncbi:cytochrome c3 family protein [Anaeromyxobacter oryzae]|uniref:cytochrome c3 family protein n=1 Tax=Anaeromyxobacter oryzae TaxID=2918170 RepID=UPI0020C10250|nr:cytochrome c3 family protein [Anaeromyxobacter oryzae]